ncbi:hypothetical protein EN817_27180 [Mesorhizobium sp. M3A.F.Ca.ET.174.01.1.1]|nr:hypothetical protein EN818_29575 [Mesorhizobium sp. M3A.F.Ca.ET.175.01.1.1]TGT22285.1 hypothetical protein EN817_27180 [Mesorhizobium sp. M3A.F.Ca.ET.174.01.1.1]
MVMKAPVADARNGSVVDRLVGIDLARGLAVFGMYAAHLGPDPGEGGLVVSFREVVHSDRTEETGVTTLQHPSEDPNEHP